MKKFLVLIAFFVFWGALEPLLGEVTHPPIQLEGGGLFDKDVDPEQEKACKLSWMQKMRSYIREGFKTTEDVARKALHHPWIQEKLKDPKIQRKIIAQLIKRYIQLTGVLCVQAGAIDGETFNQIWLHYRQAELLNDLLGE